MGRFWETYNFFSKFSQDFSQCREMHIKQQDMFCLIHKSLTHMKYVNGTLITKSHRTVQLFTTLPSHKG